MDIALGYATTETGPWWRQRRPVAINRWQTLLVKGAIAAPLTGLMTGILLLVAVAGLGMNAPHVGLLWLLAWLCAASVAAGTLVLFAVLGNVGQLVALLIFVYAGLASAGGTVPLEALPAALRWLAQVEPLRQVLDGTRSILYFDAQADAGLTRSVAAAASGLAFWLIAGAVIVRWYDSRGLNRLDPELLAYIHASADAYRSPDSSPSDPETGNADKPPRNPLPRSARALWLRRRCQQAIPIRAMWWSASIPVLPGIGQARDLAGRGARISYDIRWRDRGGACP